MPNYVTNVLTIQADPEEVRRILSAIQDGEVGLGSISFQKILPMPPALDIECGSRSRRGLELYQAMRQEREAAGDLTPEAETALRKKYEKLTDGDPAMLTLGEQCYNNIQNYGAPTWYEWRTADNPNSWQTKWEAFYYHDLPPFDGGNTIRFYTAWSSVSVCVYGCHPLQGAREPSICHQSGLCGAGNQHGRPKGYSGHLDW